MCDAVCVECSVEAGICTVSICFLNVFILTTCMQNLTNLLLWCVMLKHVVSGTYVTELEVRDLLA